MISTTTQPQRVARLRELLASDEILMLPSCYDGLTAKLIERAGYDATFMTGFGVAAAHGYPDTQLLSFGEMARSARTVCASLRRIPCIADGDTGYGNALNVKRTVAEYAQAGMAGIMIEDQVSPKRCGHTKGKAVVSREDAFGRVRAAVDARREGGFDILIMARTDARATHSLDEAIARCQEFARLGADMTFLEAPRSVDEMRAYCAQVPGVKTANMVEMGLSPVLSAAQLQEIGYRAAIYPVTLLNVGIKAMEQALEALRDPTAAAKSNREDAELGDQQAGARPNAPLNDLLCDFAHVKDVVGFNDYYKEEQRYDIARFE